MISDFVVLCCDFDGFSRVCAHNFWWNLNNLPRRSIKQIYGIFSLSRNSCWLRWDNHRTRVFSMTARNRFSLQLPQNRLIKRNGREMKKSEFHYPHFDCFFFFISWLLPIFNWSHSLVGRSLCCCVTHSVFAISTAIWKSENEWTSTERGRFDRSPLTFWLRLNSA